MGLNIDDDVGLAINAMCAMLDLPGGLAAMGVGEEQYEAIISGTKADHCHKTGPRIATLEDYRAMLIASM